MITLIISINVALVCFDYLVYSFANSERGSASLLACNPPPVSFLGSSHSGLAFLRMIHKELDLIGGSVAMWHTGKIVEQTDLLFDTARRLAPLRGGTVCEVGFNIGHSASTLMVSILGSSYVGFDYGEKGEVVKAKEFLQNLLAADNVTVELHLGNSQFTVPEYLKNFPETVCDVIHIDGSHDGHFPLSDFQNLRTMARPDGKSLVLFDDCGCPTEWCVAPLKAFKGLQGSGAITFAEDGKDFFSAGNGAVRTCYGRMSPHKRDFEPYPHLDTVAGGVLNDYE